MSYDPDKHHRRSIRLKERDYAGPGAYFVTICTRERESLFGHVVNGEMRLNEAGEIARRCWEDIPDHFPLVELDAFVIMPNHVHGIIVITEPRGGEKSFAPTDVPTTTSGTTPQSPSRTIGSIVRGSEIVIPCKGEASVPPDASEDASGSDASPLRPCSPLRDDGGEWWLARASLALPMSLRDEMNQASGAVFTPDRADDRKGLPLRPTP